MKCAYLSMFRINASAIMCVLGIAVSGCGSDNKSAGDQPAVGGTGASGGSTAAGGSSAAGTGGTGQPTSSTGGTVAGSTSPTKTQTNLTAATVTVQSTAVGAGLQLVSLNLVPDPTSSINYVEWFGEVKNTGSSQVCFPTATFTFSGSNNVVLWTGTTYADTPPYLDSSSTLSMPCLAAGETGAFWDNDLPTSAVLVSAVASLTVTLTGSTYTGVTSFPEQMTVAPVSDTIYKDGNHFAMSGSFTPQQTVYNIGIAGYTKAASGLLSGHLTATNLGTVTAGTTWSFTSLTSIQGPQPTKVLAFPDFILGAAANVTYTNQTAANAATNLANVAMLKKAAAEGKESRAQMHQNQ